MTSHPLSSCTAVVSVLCFSACVCTKPAAEKHRAPSEKHRAPSATPPARSGAAAALPASVQRGICLAHNWQGGGRRGYGSPVSMATKRELKALGATWISLTPFGWQSSVHSREVRFRPRIYAGENDDRLTREVAQARSLGLRVMLKPHLWISYSAWRGDIRPAGNDGWDAWFRSYRRFILHFARLAQRLGVDAFVVGVEMKSSSRAQASKWREIIAAVRRVYRGKLTYAANWDEASIVPFWDALDWIGVQLFAPLTKKLQPSRSDLDRGLAGHLLRYERLSRRFGKPVVFTEVGYKSVTGTAISPFAWPEHIDPARRVPNQEAQALAYEAFFASIRDRSWVAGAYVWKWFTDPGTMEEGPMGFSPRGKRAAAVLRAAYRSPRSP